MLNFEEELAKFKPVEEPEEAANLISEEPLVDLTDIMKRMLEEAQVKG
jgi:hypothetical protein